MKKLLIIATILATTNVLAASGWTNWAIPNDVELIRGEGFLVTGDFGNPAECGTTGNSLWVPSDNLDYDKLYSTVLAALMAGKEIRAYAHKCEQIGWHGGTFNTLKPYGAMYIRR